MPVLVDRAEDVQLPQSILELLVCWEGGWVRFIGRLGSSAAGSLAKEGLASVQKMEAPEPIRPPTQHTCAVSGRSRKSKASTSMSRGRDLRYKTPPTRDVRWISGLAEEWRVQQGCHDCASSPSLDVRTRSDTRAAAGLPHLVISGISFS